MNLERGARRLAQKNECVKGWHRAVCRREVMRYAEMSWAEYILHNECVGRRGCGNVGDVLGERGL